MKVLVRLFLFICILFLPCVTIRADDEPATGCMDGLRAVLVACRARETTDHEPGVCCLVPYYLARALCSGLYTVVSNDDDEL